MAQTWLLGTTPTRPGTYFRREKVGVTAEGAINGFLAVLFQSNYGEIGKVVNVDQSDLNNLSDLFGDGADAVREGLLGGALTVRAVRVGDDDGEVASVKLKNIPVTTTENVEESVLVSGTNPVTFTSSGIIANSVSVTTADGDELELNTDYTINDEGITILSKEDGRGTVTISFMKEVIIPAKDAVELSSKYVGDRNFTATIRTNLITDKRQLLIYDGTVLFDGVSFEAGGDEAQALVDALGTNKKFTARKLASGTLADITQAQMTGGKNPTVTTASYSRGTELLERYKWNCIVADTDNSAVNGILTAFVKQSYETGHLGFACIAGKSSQELEARMGYAASCNDEKIVYVLNGWYDNNGIAFDGWRAACRIGGMIASCDTNTSLTHTVISDAYELIEPLTNGEITRAEERGCLVLSLNSDDQIWIDSAINTLITPDANRDEGWSKIRRTKTRFELIQRCNDTCDKLIGKINNDKIGRATIMAAAQSVINTMIAQGKLFDGSYIEEDSRFTPEGDKTYFIIHVGDIDSAEKIFLTYRFSYANPFSET